MCQFRFFSDDGNAQLFPLALASWHLSLIFWFQRCTRGFRTLSWFRCGFTQDLLEISATQYQSSSVSQLCQSFCGARRLALPIAQSPLYATIPRPGQWWVLQYKVIELDLNTKDLSIIPPLQTNDEVSFRSHPSQQRGGSRPPNTIRTSSSGAVLPKGIMAALIPPSLSGKRTRDRPPSLEGDCNTPSREQSGHRTGSGIPPRSGWYIFPSASESWAVTHHSIPGDSAGFFWQASHSVHRWQFSPTAKSGSGSIQRGSQVHAWSSHFLHLFPIGAWSFALRVCGCLSPLGATCPRSGTSLCHVSGALPVISQGSLWAADWCWFYSRHLPIVLGIFSSDALPWSRGCKSIQLGHIHLCFLPCLASCSFLGLQQWCSALHGPWGQNFSCLSVHSNVTLSSRPSLSHPFDRTYPSRSQWSGLPCVDPVLHHRHWERLG